MRSRYIGGGTHVLRTIIIPWPPRRRYSTVPFSTAGRIATFSTAPRDLQQPCCRCARGPRLCTHPSHNHAIAVLQFTTPGNKPAKQGKSRPCSAWGLRALVRELAATPSSLAEPEKRSPPKPCPNLDVTVPRLPSTMLQLSQDVSDRAKPFGEVQSGPLVGQARHC